MNRMIRLYNKDGLVSEIVETKYGVMSKVSAKGLTVQKTLKYKHLNFDMVVEAAKIYGWKTPKDMAKMETITV
jgi:hypothetical protein